MEPLRCLIDSMVFDLVATEPGMLERVDRLTRSRRLELLASETSMRQIAATPDPWHRRALQRVRVLVLPPAVVPLPALGGRIADDDALIATVAAAHGVPLVTEDRALREAAAGVVELWRWETELRPRIRALG